jgi:hypothetical protein
VIGIAVVEQFGFAEQIFGVNEQVLGRGMAQGEISV